MKDQRIALGLLALVAVFLGSACAPMYSGLATHTIKTGEHKEADVVWVVRDGRQVVRCGNTDRGPVCTTARQE